MKPASTNDTSVRRFATVYRSVRRFVAVCRHFGLRTALRVAYSKLHGSVFPKLALPDAPIYTAHRVLSILLSTTHHDAATLAAVAGIVAERAGSDWELCISEHLPATPEVAHALARLRGTQPWLRIVTSESAVDDVTAAQWTVEQATGEFIAMLAPAYIPESDAFAALLARLRGMQGAQTAALIAAPRASDLESADGVADCLLLVQRKSTYLEAQSRRWPLTAPTVANLSEMQTVLVSAAGSTDNLVAR